MSQVAEAFVRVRPVATGFGQELDRQTAPALRRFSNQIQQSERGLGRFSRGALVGTGALQGLGRAAAFASTSFIGGAGLIYALRASVNEATNQAKILGNLRNALEASGFSWSQYRAEIEAATAATKRASAFDDEELFQSLQLLIRGTKDVNQALKLNALAADVARGRNLGLVQAAQLLVRVNAGQVGSLRRLGISVDKGITGAQALIQVQKQYAGAAEAFSRSAAGAQARLTVAIQDTEKAIGRALLPTITDLSSRLADWLNDTKNQKRIQDDVNRALRIGGEVAHDLGAAFKDVKAVADPLIETVGGLEKAVELLLAAMLVNKVRTFAGALGLVGPAAAKAGAGIAAGEAAAARGGAAAGAAGSLRFLGPIGLAVGTGLTLAQIYDDNTATLDQIYKDSTKGGFAGAASRSIIAKAGLPAALTFMDVFPALRAGLLTVKGVQTLRVRFVSDGDYQAALAYAKQNERARKAGQAAIVRASKPDPVGSGTTASGTGSPTGFAALTARQRNQLALTTALGTAGTADDLRALAEQRRLLGRAIATETDRLKHAVNAKQARKFADNLQALEAEDNRAAADIASIEQAAADQAEAARQKIKDAADKKARAQAALIAAMNKSAADRVAMIGRLGDTLIKNVKAMLAKRRAAQNAISALSRGTFENPINLPGKVSGSGAVGGAGGGYTLEQLFEFAGSQQALYGSNLGGPGTSLSPQDARGQLGGIIKAHQTMVVQNFYGDRGTGQAIADAYRVARNMK